MTPSKELPISESTGRFIDILRKYNELYSDVFSALELTFSESDCLDIINSGFYAEYKALESRLKELTMQSITNNIGREAPSEI